MRHLRRLFAVLFLLILLFPAVVSAVDFRIEDALIEASLTEGGLVHVKEEFVYTFNGGFNGITRTIHPGKGTSVDGFKAYEDGRPLSVEQSGETYRVHRQGSDSTVRIKLEYTLHGAVSLYEDGAEFYRSFFDSGNGAGYGNMTIIVHPPAASRRTDALGYGAAEETGTISGDGSARFDLGPVPAGTEADIRTVFDRSLFHGGVTKKGTIRDEVEQDRKELENREGRAKIAVTVLIPAAGLLMLFILVDEWRRSGRLWRKALREAEADKFSVPPESLSMPALIRFTAGPSRSSRLSAGLLDLIRNGYAEQQSDILYAPTGKEPELLHERRLMHLLFDRFGDLDRRFNLEQLELKTRSGDGADEYLAGVKSWERAVKKELKTAPLKKRRLSTILLLLLVIGLLVAACDFTVMLDQDWPYMTAFLMLLSAVAMLVLIRPYTGYGRDIQVRWHLFREVLPRLRPVDWAAFSRTDRIRGLIYAVGCNDPAVPGPDIPEIEPFETRGLRPLISAHSAASLGSGMAVADRNASSSSSGSSGSGGGSGVGGSGGGSGAF
ncbi:DUF2207 domain-containing protein [Edaphobacillus lindanitolerans]|uniref:Uncharacterized membrane protein n=1 Tax=Edaphobacillus lindanitolerans TaxID=550447 RepID=A0A1U7PI06_9BACI|nr:DUF2207 domain-containing protein [Edaphobacillus lindanitolerans]SIT70863.1 Uncharacterized membrane protein [Edaphobacillus lindanitolerans]